MTIAESARDALRAALEVPLDTPERRDVALLRFMLASAATWKAAQIVLLELHGFDQGSPKGCIRASIDAGLLTPADAERALKLVDDRNLMVHAYAEQIANEIAARVAVHADVIDRWLRALRG